LLISICELVDHAGVGHHLLQLGDARLQQALLLLGGVVLGVLAQVALVARLGDLLADMRAIDGLEPVEFIDELLEALFGVVGGIAHVFDRVGAKERKRTPGGPLPLTCAVIRS
jgi:hypothetical protein